MQDNGRDGPVDVEIRPPSSTEKDSSYKAHI
jgi:hypothetical protein